MLSWLYPNTCRLCGEACEDGLCESCRVNLPRMPRPLCLHCGAPLGDYPAAADTCRECCAYPREFDYARQVLPHSDAAMSLVHDLKYHGAGYLARDFARLLNELWETCTPLRRAVNPALVPVPITRARLFARGYNQAAEIAEALGRLRGLSVLPALVRRDTGAESQTRLSVQQRQENARFAYHPAPACLAGRLMLPDHVILVDDVYTTGATARACAAALKSLPGKRTVGVLAVLRAGR